jgi:hypothetical protein
VYVGKLSRNVPERDVRYFFERCGTVREVDIRKGYAFV